MRVVLGGITGAVLGGISGFFGLIVVSWLLSGGEPPKETPPGIERYGELLSAAGYFGAALVLVIAVSFMAAVAGAVLGAYLASRSECAPSQVKPPQAGSVPSDGSGRK